MINLLQGEEILKAFEVKKSPHGKGLFYVTNFRVVLETRTYGTVIDLQYQVLRNYKSIGKDCFRIEWADGNNRWYYQFKIHGSAKQVYEIYAIANSKFARSELIHIRSFDNTI